MWYHITISLWEATPQAKKTRLPYVAISFVIMALSTGNALIRATSAYDILVMVDLTTKDSVESSRVAYLHAVLSVKIVVSQLLFDLAIQIADAVLVSELSFIQPNIK